MIVNATILEVAVTYVLKSLHGCQDPRVKNLFTDAHSVMKETKKVSQTKVQKSLLSVKVVSLV